MIQLRHDAAYIRTEPDERTAAADAAQLSEFDEKVCELLSTAHTVKSAAKALAYPSDKSAAQLENRSPNPCSGCCRQSAFSCHLTAER